MDLSLALLISGASIAKSLAISLLPVDVLGTVCTHSRAMYLVYCIVDTYHNTSPSLESPSVPGGTHFSNNLYTLGHFI